MVSQSTQQKIKKKNRSMKRVCRTHLAQNTHIAADPLNTVGSAVPRGGVEPPPPPEISKVPPQDVRKKGSKILKLTMIAIILH